MGYAEELAQWRMQRKRAEITDRIGQIQAEYAQVSRERDTAISNNDIETAEYLDKDCEQLEAEYNQYVPPQRPQPHPRVLGLAQRNAAFFQKYGAYGAQMADHAHNYVVNHMRISPNSPRYQDAVLSYMELYSKEAGMPYDRGDQALTPNQAARISGLSPEAYNRSVQEIARQGRFTRNR
jgi:hypothetical protein